MPASDPHRSVVRYAVVGLGYIAQIAVLPAFRHARRNSRLVALVSGDARKRKALAKTYGVRAAVDYRAYDRLLESGDIDAVYIALPNSMHADYATRAAAAGVHVLCEKPLGVTVRECRAMISAASRAGVRLMTAYRLHFERTNLAALEWARSGRLGDLRWFSSSFSMQVREGIRLERELGGGPLFDLGIYCVNAARSLFGAEPDEVLGAAAASSDPRFAEVEETFSGVLRFPGERLASFTASFGSADVSSYDLVGTKGRLHVEPAFDYAKPLVLRATVGARTVERTYPRRDQFAPELLHFSDAVLAGRSPEPSGEEGLADLRAIEGLFRSARTGRRVVLGEAPKTRHPSPAQQIRRPAVRKPTLVRTRSPSS